MTELKSEKLKEVQSDNTKLIYMGFYSYCIFIGCYLIYNFGYMAVTALIAATFQIPSVIHYYRVIFDTPLWWWNQPNVIFTFASGPIVSAFVGILSLRFFFLFRKSKNWIRLFFLWGYHHGFNMFFGAYVSGVISRSGFRHASNWAAIPVEVEYLIAIGAMVCMFLVGFLSVKFFLQMAISQTLLVNHRRNRFITATVFLPWFLGSLTLILLKAPRITYNEALIFVMMFTSVVPVYIAQRFFYEVSIVRFDKKLSMNWFALGALVLFMFSFRYILDDGIMVRLFPAFQIYWVNH
jgi:hypothetical protein